MVEMDTPEKTQIATPVSKFEDSPVFNYLNGLSPIKPVRSIHITQSFSSLTFASLPSIFTSPHVNSHKESRFLKRHKEPNLTDVKDPSENDSKASAAVNDGSDTTRQNKNGRELQENFNTSVTTGETSEDPVDESFAFVIELPRTLKYDCGSPDCELSPPDTVVECIAQPPGDPLLQNFPESHSCEFKVDAEGTSGQKGEALQFALDSSDSKSTDVLIFSSPDDAIAFRGLVQRSPDISTGLLTSMISTVPQYEICGASEKGRLLRHVTCDEQYAAEDPSSLPSEASVETNQNYMPVCNAQTEMDDCLNEREGNDSQALVPFDYKMSADLHRGMRRRCLDFEVAKPLNKGSDDNRSCNSSHEVQVKDSQASKNRHLVLAKRGGDSSTKRILPGIGLHLNALTSSSKTTKEENTFPEASSQLSVSNQENLNSMASGKEMDPAVNGLQLTEDDPVPAYMNYEEINPLSPRKKRRREQNNENEACKRCNCKKSKCLKLYCECFAAGVYCIEPCACQDCFNKPIHEETVLATRKQIESRNPLAFAPKVIRASDSVSEIGDEPNKTPASARHKRGCNCKKSNCLKKYCECYQGGVGCSINCRCEGCKNAFGTKDGAIIGGTDCETEEESDKCEKRVVDQIAWTTDSQKNMERNDSTLLSTPSQLNRPSLPIGFPPKSKQLRSSLLNVGSSFSIHSNQQIGRPGLLVPLPRFEKQPSQTNLEDEIPDVLCGSTPTMGIIKAASPNSKRVSPPHSNFSSSPGQRSGGRRLILRSIPSFPSLTPQH